MKTPCSYTRPLLLAVLVFSGMAGIPLVRAEPSALRALPSTASPGSRIPVAIDLRLDTEGPVLVEEKVPDGWVAEDISHGGRVQEGLIRWQVEGRRNADLLLSYGLRLPRTVVRAGRFSGRLVYGGHSTTIRGDNYVAVGRALSLWSFEIDAWEALGIVATLVFASRFLVQWIESERRKKSVVPVIFWWLSLAGAFLLLLYGIHFRRLAVVLGQAFGFIVYIRNLVLIRRTR